MRQSLSIRFASVALAMTFITVTATTALVQAEEPGRGRTAAFEREFLQFIIDHHFAALRTTELAAGTDAVRDATISPAEGTAPTPDTASTPAKSGMDEIKSMARRANRMQREEILVANRMLREWYGVTYQPRLRDDARAMIPTLESRAPGAAFDQAFLMLFSRHHFTALQTGIECLTGRELQHQELQRYCLGIVEGQLLDIDDMRHMLCRAFKMRERHHRARELRYATSAAQQRAARGEDPLTPTAGPVEATYKRGGPKGPPND